MAKLVVSLLAIAVLAGCDALVERELCRSGKELFVSALEEQLQFREIEFTRRSRTELCFPAKLSQEVHGVALKAEENYRGAAVLIKTEPHKNRVLEWLNHESREYESHETESGGLFVVVFSGSKKEFQETQFSLECLQYQNGCQ